MDDWMRDGGRGMDVNSLVCSNMAGDFGKGY